MTMKAAPATAPNFTAVTPLKLVPPMVTLVPAGPPDPEVTLRPVTVGAGRGGEGELVVGRGGALVPPAAVTVTSTVPAPSAGEVTVIEVAPFTTTPVPAAVPNFTAVSAAEAGPVTVTGVPPAVDPEFGAHAGDGGAGGAVKVNWSVGGLAGWCPPPR